MKTPIVEFYTTDNKPTGARYSWSDIMRFGIEELESKHDFIQWLFPTETPSKFNPGAPVLKKADYKVLLVSDVFITRFALSVVTMLDFWGFFWTIDKDCVLLVNGFAGEGLSSSDHNVLRMTRVMESLRKFGYEETAQSMFVALRNYVLKNSANPTGFGSALAHWHLAAYG